MSLRRGLALVAALAPFVPVFVPWVRADDQTKPTARLSWVRAPGTESCVDATALEKDVSARLGRDAFGKDPSLHIDALVTRAGSVWKAQIFVRDAAGSSLGNRAIDSDAADCASLGRAVGLAIALAIDPDASSAAPSVSAAPSTSATSVGLPPKRKKPAPAAPPTPTPSASATIEPSADPANVALRAVLSAGLMPRPAPGFALVFEPFHVRGLRPVLGATYIPSQRTTDGAIGVGMTFATLGACTTTTGGDRVGVDSCFALLAGATHSTVHTLEAASPGDRAWLGASFGVRFRARLFEGLFLDVAVDGVVPITRHRFSGVFASGADATLFRQPLFSLIPALGLGWQFR